MEKLKDLENWRENRSEDSLQQEMWLFYSKWDYEKWDALGKIWLKGLMNTTKMYKKKEKK